MGPKVIFIDDHIEQLTPLSNLVNEYEASSSSVYSPGDVDKELLENTDLVIVDYSLNDWIENESVEQLSLRPINGIALAAVLREHCAQFREFPPTGFALITGQVDSFGPLPAERRPHVVSRLNNVEWFFEKGANPDVVTSNAQKIVSLASSVAALPTSVGQELGNMDALMKFLGVEGHDLSDRFREAVQRCRPPIHHLAERSHGLIILRWLLHRILPHTTFLLNTLNLAARLRVAPDWLKANLTDGSPLHDLLGPTAYTGPLCDFDGPRWWRDGVEQLLWDTTGGQSSNAAAIHSALFANAVEKPQEIEAARPVITLDHELMIEPDFSAAEDAAPIHLDDWPSYAEPAYIRRSELADHPELKMYVAEDE